MNLPYAQTSGAYSSSATRETRPHGTQPAQALPGRRQPPARRSFVRERDAKACYALAEAFGRFLAAFPEFGRKHLMTQVGTGLRPGELLALPPLGLVADERGHHERAPDAGDQVGASPVDRGKPGSKLHLVREGGGLPLTVAVTAANVHDALMFAAVLDDVPPIRTAAYPA